LKRLGTALHVVQNKLIVQSEQIVGSETNIPRTNSWVVDQKRTKVYSAQLIIHTSSFDQIEE
jgi:rRNA processing protein Gar1